MEADPIETPDKPKHKPITPRKAYEEICAIFNGNESSALGPLGLLLAIALRGVSSDDFEVGELKELMLEVDVDRDYIRLDSEKHVYYIYVKIRVPKSTHKPPRLTPSQVKLQQSCTCDDYEDDCSETCGMVCGEASCPSNRLDFQIPDDICESLTNRTALNSELIYSKTPGNPNLCNTCNVTPKDAPKGVLAQKVLHPDKDVFVLKIGKQTDEPNRTGNIEVELVTPRAPAKEQPAPHKCINIQCNEEEIPCCFPLMNCNRIVPKKRKPRRRKCCY